MDREGARKSPASVRIPFDLSALQFVLAAAEYRSFRRAAEALGQYPATISRGVQRVEDVVGVSFFERHPTGIRLTLAGERFVAATRPAIEQIITAVNLAGVAGRAEKGSLSIGLLTSLAGGFLRELIECFVSAYPEISIEVRDGGRDEHIAAIRSRELDVAFFTGSGDVVDCESAELWRERVYVALPASHPLGACQSIDWPRLRDQHFIVIKNEPGPEVRDYIIRRVADYSTYPEIEFMPCSQESLMNLVAIGRGITVVSSGWRHTSVPKLILRPLVAEEDIVPFSAVWDRSRDNPVLRRFLSMASSMAAKQASPV